MYTVWNYVISFLSEYCLLFMLMLFLPSTCKKQSGAVLTWLFVCTELQTCIWPSWCHCHSLSLASVKFRLVFTFWYWLTRVVLEKGPLNGCVCVCKFSDRSPCDLACGSEYSSFYFVPSPHSSQCLLPSVTRNKDYYYTENFTMDLNKVCGKGLSNTNWTRRML